MKVTELRSFSHFQTLTKITSRTLAEIFNLTNLDFCLHSQSNCEVSQNDHIRKYIWFTYVFLMNGTELRGFSHFEILNKIAYPDLSRNLQID